MNGASLTIVPPAATRPGSMRERRQRALAPVVDAFYTALGDIDMDDPLRDDLKGTARFLALLAGRAVVDVSEATA